MMNKSKIARAIAMAMTGTALSAAGISTASAATTMYNTFTTSSLTATDGWTTTLGFNQNPADVASGTNLVPWVGTSGFNDTRPFNYTGQAHLNWAIQLNGSGDSGIISKADSQNRYGFAAEIDTGGGAWQDNSATPTGWKHQTDIGLIRSDVTQTVTLKLATLGAQSPTFSTFGVTIFEGMDSTAYDPTNTAGPSGSNATKYSHHGSWNCPSCSPAARNFTDSNPWYRNAAGTPIGTGMTNILFSNSVDAVTGIQFTAEAGKIYTIALGGVGFSRWNAGVDGYILGVNTAPVPVPAAVWLFGSALAGMGIIGRRKNKGALVA